MKKLLYIIFLIALISVFSACKKESVESTLLEIPGAKPFSLVAQNITLPSVEGEPISLQQYKGKIIMLVVWASSCGYCQQEAPSLAELDKYLQDDNRIQLLGLSTDRNIKDAKGFIDVYGLQFPTMSDPGAQKIQRAGFEIQGTPTTFILAPNGDAVAKITGFHKFDPNEQYKTLLQLYKLYEQKN